MKKTKIEWTDATWNPVTVCLHGCEYCYARGIARRFGGRGAEDADGKLFVLEEPRLRADESYGPYPFGFLPTLHEYRLGIPSEWTKPRTIFVCSMADLFGAWVPDEWIQEVFAACAKAPQNRYLFLTKNPARYCELDEKDLLPHKENMWYGSTWAKKRRRGISGRCRTDIRQIQHVPKHGTALRGHGFNAIRLWTVQLDNHWSGDREPKGQGHTG